MTKNIKEVNLKHEHLQPYVTKKYLQLLKVTKLNKIDIPLVEVGFPKELKNPNKYAGVYDSHSNFIYLNPLLKTKEIKNTLDHEICHSIIFQEHKILTHGPKWKKLMIISNRIPLAVTSKNSIKET